MVNPSCTFLWSGWDYLEFGQGMREGTLGQGAHGKSQEGLVPSPFGYRIPVDRGPFGCLLPNPRVQRS
jgi:hypothetical protein